MLTLPNAERPSITVTKSLHKSRSEADIHLSAVDKIQKMFNSSVRLGIVGGRRRHFIQLPCYKSYCCKNIFWMSFKVLIWLLLTWFMLLDLRSHTVDFRFVSFQWNVDICRTDSENNFPKTHWNSIENIRTNRMGKKKFSILFFCSFSSVLGAVHCVLCGCVWYNFRL